jgi:F0F1-type ATP synthase membrane subunit c/vacuolar-type H+-ATPase subunit K
MSDNEGGKPFDYFELCAALLLGLGAVGAAVTGHQQGLWGGASVEAFSEASKLTTKASTTYTNALSTYMHDMQMDVRAKELIWEANDEETRTSGGRQAGMANWILLSQISDTAYRHLGLPAETREAYFNGDDEAALDDEELLVALNTELGQEYIDEVFGPSDQEFAEADETFAKGQRANSIGDEFSLAGVVFTIALFFGGLALIFKTRIRWAFLGIGSVVFFGSVAYLSTLTWA